MEIVLSPDLEQFVTDQVGTGRYTTASEIVNAALALLRNQGDDEELNAEELSELRQELAIGIEALERGDRISVQGEEGLTAFFEDIKNRGRQRLRDGQTGR